MIQVIPAPIITGFTIHAVGQIRSGRPAAADYETSIGFGTNAGQIAQTGEIVWVNGVPQAFTFRRLVTGGPVTLTMGAGTITYTPPAPARPGNALELLVRTVPADATILMDNLVLVAGSETAPLPTLLAAGANDIHSLLVRAPVAGVFTLTGRVTFTWTGTFPQSSRLLAMVKVGSWVGIPDGTEERQPKRRMSVRYPLLILPALLTTYFPDWSTIMPDILRRIAPPPLPSRRRSGPVLPQEVDR